MKPRRGTEPEKVPQDSPLEEVGGEPLAGSGFETEEPELGFANG